MSSDTSAPTVPQSAPAPAPAVPAAPPRAGRKRWIALSIFGVVLCVAAVAGVLYWLHARQFEETDDAAIDGNMVMVSPQVAGRISAVYVQDNDDVPAGKVIAEIDATDFITRVAQSRAALETAEARLRVAQTNVDLVKANTAALLVQGQAGVAQATAAVEQMTTGIDQAEATVRSAEAQVQSAEADVQAAQAEAGRRESDVKRYEALDPRAISQQTRDAAKSAADAAAAQLSAAQKRKVYAEAQVALEKSKVAEARAKVTEAKSKVSQAEGILQAAQTAPQQIASVEAQVKTAQAGVDQAQAELRDAQQQQAYTKIVAPVAGRVTRKAVQLGQYVEAGRTLVTLVEPDVWVTANFKENQLAHMHAGQVVDVWVDAYPGMSFRGKVASIQAGTGARFSLMPPENATGNFVKVVQRVPVKIVFDEGGAEGGGGALKRLLAPGMSAVPRVRIAGNEGSPEPIAHGAASAAAASH